MPSPRTATVNAPGRHRRLSPSSVLQSLGFLIAPGLHRRRNAKAAAWLDGLPQYLLDDIGIDRRAIAGIRRHGHPSPHPSTATSNDAP